MAEMKTLNGYEIVDGKGRTEIESLKAEVEMLVQVLKPYMAETWELKEYVNNVTYHNWKVSFTSNGNSFNGFTTGTEDEYDPYLFYGDLDVCGMGTGGAWLDEAYRTITIFAGQELPTDFITWLNDNATFKGYQLVINGGGGGNSNEDVSGDWLLDESVDTSSDFEWNVKFTHDGSNYQSMTCYEVMGEISFDGTNVYSGGWTTIDAPNPVITIEAGQTLDAKFVTWLKANATKI